MAPPYPVPFPQSARSPLPIPHYPSWPCPPAPLAQLMLPLAFDSAHLLPLIQFACSPMGLSPCSSLTVSFFPCPTGPLGSDPTSPRPTQSPTLSPPVPLGPILVPQSSCLSPSAPLAPSYLLTLFLFFYFPLPSSPGPPGQVSLLPKAQAPAQVLRYLS
jgi:hypothetical protein